MPDWVATLLGAAIGAGLAVVGAFAVSLIMENRRQRRELAQFYSWTASLLERLDMGSFADVSSELSAQTLHYTFNRLWGQIPESGEIQSTEIRVRELILKFIKGGDRLKEFKGSQEFSDLREWLAARSR